jgi:hypothetical protein
MLAQDVVAEIEKTEDNELGERLAGVIESVASKLSLPERSEFVLALSDRLEKEVKSDKREMLLSAFAAFAAELPADKISTFWALTAESFEKATDKEFNSLNKTFASLIPQLQPDAALKAFLSITSIIHSSTDRAAKRIKVVVISPIHKVDSGAI